MSISGDKTGIVGTWISGKKTSIDSLSQSKDLYYTVAFAVCTDKGKKRETFLSDGSSVCAPSCIRTGQNRACSDTVSDLSGCEHRHGICDEPRQCVKEEILVCGDAGALSCPVFTWTILLEGRKYEIETNSSGTHYKCIFASSGSPFCGRSYTG